MMQHVLKLALGLALIGGVAGAQPAENPAQAAQAQREKVGAERLAAHQRVVDHDAQRLQDVHNRELHDANRGVQVERAKAEREQRDAARLAQHNADHPH